MGRARTGGRPTALSAPRIGVDLADAEAVSESIQYFGDRYLDRVYSAEERHQTGEDPLRLAARFAGKEAVFKLIRTTSGISYRQVEILNDETGAPTVKLTRQAALAAEEQRLGPIAISLTHERGLALATAIALLHNQTPL